MTAPLSPDELLNLAQQRLTHGDLLAADNFVAMVLEKYPARADAWALAAQIALASGDADSAGQRIAHSLAHEPAQPHALGLRARLHQRRGDWPAAIADYKVALARRPDDGQLCYHLATCLHVTGARQDALALYRRAITLLPQFADAWNNLGVAAQELGQGKLAITAYRQALALDASQPLTHNNLATLLQAQGDAAVAELHYRQALVLDSRYAVAWKNLGALLQSQGRWPDAMAAYDAASMLVPDYAEALAGGLHTALQSAHWDGLAERKAALDAALARDQQARVPPFAYLGTSDDAAMQRSVAERWASAFPPAAPAPLRTTQGRIRIGYLGGDFYGHATSWLTAGLFKNHDRGRFEVFGYDYGRDDGSATRQAVMAGFDHFHALAGQAPTQIAERIRADGIDILIDLKGWTRSSQAELMSLRPAPVQLHYLAYPGTLGAAWCDYLIADPIVAPPGCEADFAEALIRLPHCYQINDVQRGVAPIPSRQAQGLPDEAVVFCCFNQHYKIQPDTFALWMQLLHEVDGSVLWLLAGHATARANLQAQAACHGVDAARLVFAPSVPQDEHIARLALADLALDTFPFTSHTTASDALWAGVPLVTRSGNSFASRVAASCLLAAGLPELVTATPDAYLALARRLAQDEAGRRTLRQRLAQQARHAPLFNTRASVAALEAAYLEAWRRYTAGQPPSSFNIEG